MPQMAPMNWLTLFIFFSVIFIMFNSINYFFFMNNPMKSSFKIMKKNTNWKW